MHHSFCRLFGFCLPLSLILAYGVGLRATVRPPIPVQAIHDSQGSTRASVKRALKQKKGTKKKVKPRKKEKDRRKLLALLLPSIVLIVWVTNNIWQNHIKQRERGRGPYPAEPLSSLQAGVHYDSTKVNLGNNTYDIYNPPSDGNCWLWACIPLFLLQVLYDQESFDEFKSKLPTLYATLEANERRYEDYVRKAEALKRDIQNNPKPFLYFFTEDVRLEKEHMAVVHQQKVFNKKHEKNKNLTKKELQEANRLSRERVALENSYTQFLEDNQALWLRFQDDRYAYQPRLSQRGYKDLFAYKEKSRLDLGRQGIQPVLERLQQRIDTVVSLQACLQELKDKERQVLCLLKDLSKIGGIKKKLEHINKRELGLFLVRWLRLASQLLEVKRDTHTVKNSRRNPSLVDSVRMDGAWGSPYDLEGFAKHFGLHIVSLRCQATCSVGGGYFEVGIYSEQKKPIYEYHDRIKHGLMIYVNDNHYRYVLRKE